MLSYESVDILLIPHQSDAAGDKSLLDTAHPIGEFCVCYFLLRFTVCGSLAFSLELSSYPYLVENGSGALGTIPDRHSRRHMLGSVLGELFRNFVQSIAI